MKALVKYERRNDRYMLPLGFKGVERCQGFYWLCLCSIDFFFFSFKQPVTYTYITCSLIATCWWCCGLLTVKHTTHNKQKSMWTFHFKFQNYNCRLKLWCGAATIHCLVSNYFDNWWIVLVVFQMTNCCFQPLRSEDVQLFFVICDSKLSIFGFWTRK